jgi:polysaccharide biosynthesis transport protein
MDGSRVYTFIRENWLIFLGVMAAALGLAALYTFLQDPVYATKSSVIIEQRRTQVVQGLEDVVSPLPLDSSVVDTEVQLLESSGTAYQVAQKAGLVPNIPFQNMSPEQQEETANVIRDIMEHRSVARVGLTFLIEIGYESSDPETAQKMANIFATNYIESQIDVRVQENARAKQYLEEEIAKLREQVKTADIAISQYKAANNLSGNRSAGGTLTEQEISSYNQTLAAARAAAAEDAQRLAATRAQLARGTDQMGDLNAPGLAQLRAQQSAVSARVADLSSRYGPNHPELIAARQQLADLNSQISSQAQRVVAGLEAQAQASQGRVNELAAKLSSTQGQLQRADAASVRLRELEGQLQAPQTLLDAYMARLSQISTQSGSERPDARIASFAPFPVQPAGPSLLINMLVGGFLGLIIFAIIALVRQVFAIGVGSPEEVEGLFGVDFLAALPKLKNDDDMSLINQVVENPGSPFAESVRTLSASLFTGSSQRAQVIAITSSNASEGKTTTAIALGRSQALRGKRVLIVDCDMHRPTFTSRFGFGQGGPGLFQVVNGEANLADCLVDDSLTRAQFLPVGDGIGEGQMLDYDALRNFFESAKSQYDLVLLDLPPVLQVADARILASAADGTVLLSRWKHTSRKTIEFAIATLTRANCPVLGLVLTEVPVNSEMMVGGYGYNAPKKLKFLES